MSSGEDLKQGTSEYPDAGHAPPPADPASGHPPPTADAHAAGHVPAAAPAPAPRKSARARQPSYKMTVYASDEVEEEIPRKKKKKRKGYASEDEEFEDVPPERSTRTLKRIGKSLKTSPAGEARTCTNENCKATASTGNWKIGTLGYVCHNCYNYRRKYGKDRPKDLCIKTNDALKGKKCINCGQASHTWSGDRCRPCGDDFKKYKSERPLDPAAVVVAAATAAHAAAHAAFVAAAAPVSEALSLGDAYGRRAVHHPVDLDEESVEEAGALDLATSSAVARAAAERAAEVKAAVAIGLATVQEEMEAAAAADIAASAAAAAPTEAALEGYIPYIKHGNTTHGMRLKVAPRQETSREPGRTGDMGRDLHALEFTACTSLLESVGRFKDTLWEGPVQRGDDVIVAASPTAESLLLDRQFAALQVAQGGGGGGGMQVGAPVYRHGALAAAAVAPLPGFEVAQRRRSAAGRTLVDATRLLEVEHMANVEIEYLAGTDTDSFVSTYWLILDDGVEHMDLRRALEDLRRTYRQKLNRRLGKARAKTSLTLKYFEERVVDRVERRVLDSLADAVLNLMIEYDCITEQKRSEYYGAWKPRKLKFRSCLLPDSGIWVPGRIAI